MNNPILITGVGKRIGYHLATHFLEQDIPVIGTYRTSYDSIDTLKNLGADLYELDFYKQTHIEGFIASIKTKYDSLRAIIHNASDWIPESSSHSPEAVIGSMMTIHASVPYQINLALSPMCATSNNADIIHITDYVAQTGSEKHIAYAASKAALENLTLSFAKRLAPNIKVNSIAPALIKFNPNDGEDYKLKALNKALLPREGGYESIIETVNYLLSSEYVTGRSFALDGGRHLK